MPLVPPLPVVFNGASSHDESESTPMFSPKLLESVCSEAKIATVFGAENNLRIRPLYLSDYKNGYLSLLGQLTSVGDINPIEWRKTFDRMNQSGMYYIVVIEEISSNKIVGNSTLCLEQKFIHQCSLRGRVEEVVVDKAYNGQGLGKVLMTIMVALAKQIGVYKLSLDCRTELISFYEKFGYKNDGGVYLVQRFYDKSE